MEGPCYANFVLDYFRQLPTGELIIGGFRQLQKDVEVGLSDEITDVILMKKKKTPKKKKWHGVICYLSDI